MVWSLPFFLHYAKLIMQSYFTGFMYFQTLSFKTQGVFPEQAGLAFCWRVCVVFTALWLPNRWSNSYDQPRGVHNFRWGDVQIRGKRMDHQIMICKSRLKSCDLYPFFVRIYFQLVGCQSLRLSKTTPRFPPKRRQWSWQTSCQQQSRSCSTSGCSSCSEWGPLFILFHLDGKA